MTNKSLFFPYSWHVNEENIEVYGWIPSARAGEYETARLSVEGFRPFVFVKLDWDWSETLVTKIQNMLEWYAGTRDDPDHKPQRLVSRSVFTNVYQEPNEYLYFTFPSEKRRRWFTKKARDGCKIGNDWYHCEVFEDAATPMLQMTCHRKIAMADWFVFDSLPIDEPEESDCEHDLRARWTSLAPYTGDAAALGIPEPILLSYDIECFSHDPAIFCDETHPDDAVFQISAVVGKLSEPREGWRRYLLTLGNPDMVINGEMIDMPNMEVRRFTTEPKLLLGFRDLIRETKPQLLIGYNLYRFDNKYLLGRANMFHIGADYMRQGCTGLNSGFYKGCWESSAYGRQEFFYVKTFGRVTIDVFTLVSRDYKLESYKLEAVSRHLLGDKGKMPITPYDINTFYKESMKDPRAPSRHLGVLGYYCIRDSELPFELFQKLKSWYSLLSMSNICQIPMIDLCTRGQGVKVFSQVYKYCQMNDLIVENAIFGADLEKIDPIQGADVLEPQPGLYKRAVSYDFSSLYPSIIQSMNIDYSTLVQDADNVPDEKCHVIEWEEHFGCTCPGAKPAKKRDSEKLTICKKLRYRWLKEPAGVLPSIISQLISERKRVRAMMKSMDPASSQYMIQNNMQLALKVSANSMYGTLATQKGYLPFPCAGMCVTAVGRASIHKLVHILETHYGARIIYGDTDSAYATFPNVAAADLQQHCTRIAAEITEKFPKPMRLEFEKIYWHYCLLSKKRYVSLTGKLGATLENMTLDAKGILLKRRDNPEINRYIYKDILYALWRRESPEALHQRVLNHLAVLISGCSSVDMYGISSSVKVIDSWPIRPRNDTKLHYGAYIVSRLSDDEKKRAKQLQDKKVETEEEFYRACLPRQVQLALRMIARGQSVQNGARLSFVYTKRGGPKATATAKMEDCDYVKQLNRKGFIDTLYYAQLLRKPLSELLTVCLGGNYYEILLRDLCITFGRFALVRAELEQVWSRRIKLLLTLMPSSG